MPNYLITGGTGYIGSMIIKEIYIKAESEGEEAKVTAIVRDMDRARQILPRGTKLLKADVTDVVSMERIKENIDYIIHCAAVTTSAYMVTNPVETADGIVLGTRNILELARRHKIKGMVYLSSMEVYGTVTDIGRTRREDELGEVDVESPRSCYPLGKRMAEHYCHIYNREYEVPVKIARLAQTFGKGVRKSDNRVYMQFARSVVEGRNIVLQTEGRSMGNYCDIEDAIRGIFLVLEYGDNGQVYNVVNEKNTMSIRDMAELVAAEIAKGKVAVYVQSQTSLCTGYASDTKLRLSGEKLRGLGWRPQKDLIGMYKDVIAELEK